MTAFRLPTARDVAVALLATAALALPASAEALTVEGVEQAFVNVKGGDGERNDVRIVRDGDAVVVTDAGAPLVAGVGCVRREDSSVRCALEKPIVNVEVDTGDGDDVVRAELPGLDEVQGELGEGADRFEGGADFSLIEGAEGDDVLITTGAGSANFQGNAGDDVVTGGGSDDYVSGGSGRDVVTGGPGDDRIGASDKDFESSFGDQSPFADDRYDGGEGSDIISYEHRTIGVRVDLADPGPDGGGGESDTLAGIEHVHGSLGGDRIGGDDQGNLLLGDFGPDTIDGRGGGDVVFAGGNDTRDGLGKPGIDRAMGGPGNDTVRAGGPRATLDGGPGNDELTPGASGVSSVCGPGFDVVLVQPRTAPTVDRTCDRWAMKLGIVPERAFYSRLALPVFSGGSVRVAVPCSRQEGAPCVFTLQATSPAGVRLGSAEARAAAGQRRTLVARLRSTPSRVRVSVLLRRPNGTRTIRAGVVVATR